MPVVTYPPPWETGPSAADPAISASFGSYTGPGYAGNGYTAGSGEVGTINAGANTPVTPNPPRAQLRFYVGADGNLYALDNVSGKAWTMSPTANVPQPASES